MIYDLPGTPGAEGIPIINRKSQIIILPAKAEKKTARVPGQGTAGGWLESGYFFFFLVASKATRAASVLAARCWNLSTRPAVSTNFCWPV
jgi:hypothetical protein